MTVDIEYIAKGLSPKARKYKDGWITCCPAHDDKTPSLVITPGLSEDFTVHCFAACDWKAIKAAIIDKGLYTWTPTGNTDEQWIRKRAAQTFVEQVKDAIEEARQEAVKPFRSVADFLPYAAQLPPPEQVCGPFQSHSSGFIAAPGGSGKSMLTLGLAKALAEGKPFAGWETPKARRVYMLDVEMSDTGLFVRLRALGFHGKLDIRLDTSGQRDAMELPRFQLGNDDHMRILMQNASDCDVIIVDNVSACLTLLPGKDLYSPEAWQSVFVLESWARQNGKLLIFVDHTNRAGQLAGTLHKHRMADFVVLLERQSIPGEPWLEFLCKVDKIRYDAEPEDLVDRLIRLQDGNWSWSDPVEGDDDVYMQVIAGTITKVDAAQQLDITRTTLDKRLKRFKVRLRRKQHDRFSEG